MKTGALSAGGARVFYNALQEVVMSTWSEDYAHSLDSLGLPHPADLGPEEIMQNIYDLAKGIEVSGAGLTVGELIMAGAAEEALTAAAALSASFYVGALIGAGIYASARQGWDFLTSGGPSLMEIYKQFEAQVPVITLAPSPEDLSGPDVHVEHEDAPPPPPYPGHLVASGCPDTASTRLVQARLLGLGYTEVVVDGDFGSDTESAVRSFQEQNDLDADGKVGPDTWAALFSR